MIICMHCAIRANNEGHPYAGEPDATIEEHLARVHPDPKATAVERLALERQLQDRRLPRK